MEAIDSARGSIGAEHGLPFFYPSMGEQKMPKHEGCFDCGRLDIELLTSITVSGAPRQTVRGLIKPGANSVALCDECKAKEEAKKS